MDQLGSVLVVPQPPEVVGLLWAEGVVESNRDRLSPVVVRLEEDGPRTARVLQAAPVPGHPGRAHERIDLLVERNESTELARIERVLLRADEGDGIQPVRLAGVEHVQRQDVDGVVVEHRVGGVAQRKTIALARTSVA